MDCKVIFGFLLGLIGSFFGAFIAHIFSDNRRKKEEFNKAAAAFRATFVDEIFHIKKDPGPFFKRFGECREDIEIANEKAKIIFEAFLSPGQIPGFNAAWEQYKNPDEKHKIKEPPWDAEYIKKLGEIRLSHINTLLKYAKPK